MKIHDAYEQFIRDRMVYCSPDTIDTYRGHMHNYLTWLESYAESLEELPPDLHPVTGYVLQLRQSNPQIKNSSILSYCRTIKTFLRWAYENDLCPDYLRRLKLPRSDAEPKLPLLADEVMRIDACFDLNELQGLRNYCIIHLMLDCGLRSQEVRHLCMEHLMPERNLLHIHNSKGNKSRITLCPDSIYGHILKYTHMTGHSSGCIFRSLKDDVPLTEDAVKKLFQKLKSRSGVNRVHAHLCRHTFATSYLLGGGNLEFLRVFMGHSNYDVTKVYTETAALCKMLGLKVYQLDPIFFERGY